MNYLTTLAVMLLATSVASLPSAAEQPPSRADVERSMGLRSAGDLVRGQLDTLGFVVTGEQAEDVVLTANEWVGYAAVGYR